MFCLTARCVNNPCKILTIILRSKKSTLFPFPQSPNAPNGTLEIFEPIELYHLEDNKDTLILGYLLVSFIRVHSIAAIRASLRIFEVPLTQKFEKWLKEWERVTGTSHVLNSSAKLTIHMLLVLTYFRKLQKCCRIKTWPRCWK